MHTTHNTLYQGINFKIMHIELRTITVILKIVHDIIVQT